MTTHKITEQALIEIENNLVCAAMAINNEELDLAYDKIMVTVGLLTSALNYRCKNCDKPLPIQSTTEGRIKRFCAIKCVEIFRNKEKRKDGQKTSRET